MPSSSFEFSSGLAMQSLPYIHAAKIIHKFLINSKLNGLKFLLEWIGFCPKNLFSGAKMDFGCL